MLLLTIKHLCQVPLYSIFDSSDQDASNSLRFADKGYKSVFEQSLLSLTNHFEVQLIFTCSTC